MAVARAIYERRFASPEFPCWDQAGAVVRSVVLDQAEAAIAAVRRHDLQSRRDAKLAAPELQVEIRWPK